MSKIPNLKQAAILIPFIRFIPKFITNNNEKVDTTMTFQNPIADLPLEANHS